MVRTCVRDDDDRRDRHDDHQPEHLSAIPSDVGMLVHDMGLHALGLHTISAADWDALAAFRKNGYNQSSALGRTPPHLGGTHEGT